MLGLWVKAVENGVGIEYHDIHDIDFIFNEMAVFYWLMV